MRTGYYGTERQLTHYEEMQQRFTLLGKTYMQGETSIAEIQYVLNHEIYHYLFSRKEATDFVRTGVEWAINEESAIAARVQPTQDAAEVAHIAARKKRAPKVAAHNKAVKLPFTAKEVEEAGQYGWVQCHITIKP
jgi:hypothetical protein